jgi:ubiquinone/menaquinone biosynthesis C-methylase UbiE
MSNNKTKDNFAHKSKSWDMNSKRVLNAKSIADGIKRGIKLDNSMTIVDLGAGTGLLSYFIAPDVKEIIAVDNSPSMLEVFKEKEMQFDCDIKFVEMDFSKDTLDRKVNGIISSMTIHHIEDTKALFEKLYNMLDDNGFIALADLEIEDGSFHSDNKGVYHFGFDIKSLETIAKDIGFKEIDFQIVSTISKPHQDFTVFLMSAKK